MIVWAISVARSSTSSSGTTRGLGLPEAGGLAADDNVRTHDDLVAAGDAGPLDGGDRWLAGLPEEFDRIDVGGQEAVAGVAVDRTQLLEAPAGTEVLAGGPQDDRVHALVGVACPDGVAKLP